MKNNLQHYIRQTVGTHGSYHLMGTQHNMIFLSVVCVGAINVCGAVCKSAINICGAVWKRLIPVNGT